MVQEKKKNSWLRSEALRATVKFSDKLSQGRYPLMYQQTRKGFCKVIFIFFHGKLKLLSGWK